MIARELISDTIPPVKSTDKLERALEWMGEFKLTQLPIVDDGNFLGIITENDLLDAIDLEATVGETRFSIWDSAYAIENQHILELIRVMAAFKLDFIPVLDNKNKYLGLVTIKDLVINLGDQFAIRETGSIIVVEVEKKSYVLSEIGRIVESADAKVLNLSLDVHPRTGEVKITLKVNVENPSGVVAAFERFDYRVLETYQRAGDENDSLRNYENLMHFLNL